MRLSTATICTAATIGVLIPPSLTFIVYGLMTHVSIGQLFMAGIFPGLLFCCIMIAFITFTCYRNPKLGPAGSPTPWKERIFSLKDVWAVGVLILLVLGGIYAGIFTPTEAGAIGAFGAIVIGLARRRLSFKGFVNSVTEAVVMVGILMFIFIFATAFIKFIAITRITFGLADWITGLGLNKYIIITFIIIIYMFLGCVMNALPAIILTLPVLFPIAMGAGWNEIWFGVIIVIMLQLGTITPPIGMNVFAMSVVVKDVPMYSIFRGILPYWVAFIVLTIILVAFPQICLFLPGLMVK